MRENNFNIILYKYRFFFIYVIFGFISILIELLIYSNLIRLTNLYFFSQFFSLLIGILSAFWLNIRYNFKISRPKRNRALIYFMTISMLSYLIQTFILKEFYSNNTYEVSRLIVSGFFFWIAYIFHRIFSFNEHKKVGVAIYSNGVDDISKIHEKVGQYPDFIHVDIVDKTFNPLAENVLSYKVEVIRAYWSSKFIEVHIMSKIQYIG